MERGEAWAVGYVITLDTNWVTTTAQAWGRSGQGDVAVRLETVGPGRWHVNGRSAPELDGCVDVDLESSACTNTIPVHRLRIGVGQTVEAPAAYVGALDLGVERLEQSYARLEDDGLHRVFRYRAPAFDFESRLVFDVAGLVAEYPGIASRAR
ncbi:MAG: putative glycolipid-binding domain-containing protein [Actinomycetota bacterium]|nr:putative glycolipid-binding domain-containing protein [Actinomycetota bacterium]